MYQFLYYIQANRIKNHCQKLFAVHQIQLIQFEMIRLSIYWFTHQCHLTLLNYLHFQCTAHIHTLNECNKYYQDRFGVFYVPLYQHSNHELMNSNGVRISQNFKLNSTNVTMNLRHVKEWQLLTLNTTLHWNKRSKMCAWHKRSTRCGIQFGIHAVNFLCTFKAQKIHLYCILYWIHLLLRILRWLTGLLIRILCKH